MRIFFEKVIVKLLQLKDLTEREAGRVFGDLFAQKLSHDQAKTLLLLLAAKGEAASEVVGCVKALRRLEPPMVSPVRGAMDTCGTGGDGSCSINVSTLSALVIAGAGGYVAKHGNRALSSRSGSSDLLEALGVRLDAGRRRMVRSLKMNGIGYFHAPLYHPVFSRMQALRRELRVRTIFNLLGPLVNPVRIRYQLVGVSRPENVALFAGVLSRAGMLRALVCHSEDGMDEISTASDTRAAVVEGTRVRYIRIRPRQLGFRQAKKSDYAGGNVKKNRELALSILRGRATGPGRDLVLMNSGAGLYVAGIAKNIKAGIELARRSLSEGRAYQALCALRNETR
ncbi:MAG: anthranilate phosphoribosyltransferase [Candidatus Omnitrophota bacterium]|nr:anthranilate phosphoribosyltransferase [Candidatus Omnitrophota bacterium]